MPPIRPNIGVEYTEHAAIVVINREKLLDGEDIRLLEESIMNLVDQGGMMNLILDFRNVKFLSSAVLGLLICISKRIYEKQGQFRLCNINPQIHKVFEITGLISIFDIYADLASANADLSLKS
ncbi:MAG: STAS domain-containing protein [Planctomycetota bacterium]|jgi:anti-anti-sigma factor